VLPAAERHRDLMAAGDQVPIPDDDLEDGVDDFDLKELHSFLATCAPQDAAPALAAAAAVEQTPTDAAQDWKAMLGDGRGLDRGRRGPAPAAAPAPAALQAPPSAAAGELALPPGFENGPETNAPAPAQGAARQKSNRLHGEDAAKVKVELADPTAPYLSTNSWEELRLAKPIMDAIYDMGFTKPSKIQEWTLPIAIRGENIIGQAQNGSGKTAAFALSMLIVTDPSDWSPQGVCVCPTRELAMQNFEVLKTLGKFSEHTYFLAVAQIEKIPKKVQDALVVGTPGKLQDLMKKKIIDPKGIKIFVVDEADMMLDEENQMGPQVLQIKKFIPGEPQVLFFSATWPDRVSDFARNMVTRPNRITVEKNDLTLTTITQTFIDCGDGPRGKLTQLCDIYGALNVGQSIIFVNTRKSAFDIARSMKQEGHAVSLICGTQRTGEERIDESYRDLIMQEFRTGVTKVLVATDVLCRGIDVPAVTMVVNYDLPMSYWHRGNVEFDTYIHRIGRTGRFGLKGLAVNLISSQERGSLKTVEQHYNCQIAQITGDCEEMEKIVKALR